MTKQEYAEYEQSVREFFEREGITNLSQKATEDDGTESEPYFSWSPCECCGSHLGGNREDCSGYNPETKEIYEYRVCSDCVYYAECGQLDDMTMLELA